MGGGCEPHDHPCWLALSIYCLDCDEQARRLRADCTEHFLFAEGFESGGMDGGDGNGLTHAVEDFNGVAARPSEALARFSSPSLELRAPC